LQGAVIPRGTAIAASKYLITLCIEDNSDYDWAGETEGEIIDPLYVASRDSGFTGETKDEIKDGDKDVARDSAGGCETGASAGFALLALAVVIVVRKKIRPFYEQVSVAASRPARRSGNETKRSKKARGRSVWLRAFCSAALLIIEIPTGANLARLIVPFQSFFSGTIASFLPSDASTLMTVPICGLVYPFSMRAIIGCLTPLISPSFRWLMPCSRRALTSSPMSATFKSHSAISSGV
jgi:hypothetical protein